MLVSICETCDQKRYCDGAIVGRKNSFCVSCSAYQQTSPRTNADRIRSMTDEELAIVETAKGGCPHDCETPDDLDTNCVECWLDWLRQEDSYNDR